MAREERTHLEQPHRAQPVLGQCSGWNSWGVLDSVILVDLLQDAIPSSLRFPLFSWVSNPKLLGFAFI